MIQEFLSIFLIFFLLINPIGLVPIFLSLTDGASNKYKIRMAKKGVFISFILLVFFGFFGQPILSGLGVSISAFKIGGGLLLGITGFRMVLEFKQRSQKEKAEEINNQDDWNDISVFPIATLFISGPGSITTTMLLMNKNAGHIADQMVVILALASVLTIALFSLILSGKISKYLPEDITVVISKVLGLLIISISIQFIFDGIKTAFKLI